MGLLGARLYVAFDASAVTGAIVQRGLQGRSLRAFAHAALPAGALDPSGTTPNLVRPEEVRDSLRRVLAEVDHAGVAGTLVLPHGVARIALLEPPVGVDERDFVRFRLAPSLPWPSGEAIFDSLPTGNGRVVGAAVRRTVVAEYEQAAAMAGVAVEGVNLDPLLALAGLRRDAPEARAHLMLGDVAFCLAAFREGALVALRHRRRDRSEGESGRLLAEAERTMGDGPLGRVRLAVSGPGAAALRRELGEVERGSDGAWEWPEAAEASWLSGVLA